MNAPLVSFWLSIFLFIYNPRARADEDKYMIFVESSTQSLIAAQMPREDKSKILKTSKMLYLVSCIQSNVISPSEKVLIYDQIIAGDGDVYIYWMFEVNSVLLNDGGEELTALLIKQCSEASRNKAAKRIELHAMKGNPTALAILEKSTLLPKDRIEFIREMIRETNVKEDEIHGRGGGVREYEQNGPSNTVGRTAGEKPQSDAEPPAPKP